MQEAFNYSIPGGLEPGETTTWNLVPSAFSSDWKKASKDNSSAELTVRPYQADGTKGDTLHNARKLVLPDSYEGDFATLMTSGVMANNNVLTTVQHFDPSQAFGKA